MLLSQHSCLMTVSAQGWLVEVVFRNLPTAYPCIKDSSSRPGHSEHVQIKSNAHLTGRERKVRESQTSSDFYIACILLLSINKFTFWFIEKKKKKNLHSYILDIIQDVKEPIPTFVQQWVREITIRSCTAQQESNALVFAHSSTSFCAYPPLPFFRTGGYRRNLFKCLRSFRFVLVQWRSKGVDVTWRQDKGNS